MNVRIAVVAVTQSCPGADSGCAGIAAGCRDAVQTARNAISAATWIAGIAALLATAGLTVLLDSSKTERIGQLAVSSDVLCV